VLNVEPGMPMGLEEIIAPCAQSVGTRRWRKKKMRDQYEEYLLKRLRELGVNTRLLRSNWNDDITGIIAIALCESNHPGGDLQRNVVIRNDLLEILEI